MYEGLKISSKVYYRVAQLCKSTTKDDTKGTEDMTQSELEGNTKHRQG